MCRRLPRCIARPPCRPRITYVAAYATSRATNASARRLPLCAHQLTLHRPLTPSLAQPRYSSPASLPPNLRSITAHAALPDLHVARPPTVCAPASITTLRSVQYTSWHGLEIFRAVFDAVHLYRQLGGRGPAPRGGRVIWRHGLGCEASSRSRRCDETCCS
ncbi:hypothetical protein B0H12DRAFT_298181 [Mycena haematopus]|nr:hypothetical protein B0H12DRAFT_298181 [Mycena haematopus]